MNRTLLEEFPMCCKCERRICKGCRVEDDLICQACHDNDDESDEESNDEEHSDKDTAETIAARKNIT